MNDNYDSEEKDLAPFQKIAIIFWIIILTVMGYCQIFYSQYFSVNAINAFLIQNHRFTLAIFLLLVCFRPIILIPGTALLFAGLLIFDPVIVFICSLIGSVISGIGVYFLSNFLGFDKVFQKQYLQQIIRFRPYIQKYGMPFIAVWSAFPLVPDDLICYLSGALRFPFWQFILAFSIGGALPIAVYSFGIGHFIELW